MASIDWIEEFGARIMVCDREGVIVQANAKSRESYAKEGVRDLVGANALDCHPGPARAKLAALLASGGTNVYTIEKQGVRKLIYQSPWYENGECKGLVELSLEIPKNMPHHVRG
ncbi:MAG: hypothetical protein PHU25_18220 [Deltaproteobacteria bacterium]|nr:hypothetical protein [Deltaproteobacteria bacterium]